MIACEHRFIPFPGSLRSLYCERCGVGRDAGSSSPERSPRPARKRARHPVSRAGQTETPELPFGQDADRDAALEVLARNDLETQVRAIVDGAGLPEDEADEVTREALDFGPALDLDNFAARIDALGAGTRSPYAASDA